MQETQEQPKREAISLLRVLAQGSTDKARALIKAHGKGDAKDYADLEMKLAELYRTAPDKIEIEKEFVKIHPHTEFILKYNQPEHPIKIEAVATEEKKANCDGGTCSCGKSSVEGKAEVKIDEMPKQNNNNILIASIAIVAVFALYLHHTKN